MAPGALQQVGAFFFFPPVTLLFGTEYVESMRPITTVMNCFCRVFLPIVQVPANVLYLEHPAPTGFSFCDPGPCDWNDETQSETSYKVFVEFFKQYPELADNPFYASGESYAGVLVPTLAAQILNHTTDENKHKAPWSLKGFALGNDCPGERPVNFRQ